MPNVSLLSTRFSGAPTVSSLKVYAVEGSVSDEEGSETFPAVSI